MMIAVNAHGLANAGWMGASSMGDAMGLRGTCAVRFIDRHTGAEHRINGRPLVAFSRQPAEAAAELLLGRDPAVWEARIEPLRQEVRK